MRLDAWLKCAGLTQKDFARRVGVSDAAVSLWINRRTVPDARRLPIIEAATSGAVTVHDFAVEPNSIMQEPPPAHDAGAFGEAQAPFATEARALGLDPDAIAARAIQDAIRAEKARRWQEENREALEAQNAWIEKHGLPLAKYRMF